MCFSWRCTLHRTSLEANGFGKGGSHPQGISVQLLDNVRVTVSSKAYLLPYLPLPLDQTSYALIWLWSIVCGVLIMYLDQPRESYLHRKAAPPPRFFISTFMFWMDFLGLSIEPWSSLYYSGTGRWQMSRGRVLHF